MYAESLTVGGIDVSVCGYVTFIQFVGTQVGVNLTSTKSNQNPYYRYLPISFNRGSDYVRYPRSNPISVGQFEKWSI